MQGANHCIYNSLCILKYKCRKSQVHCEQFWFKKWLFLKVIPLKNHFKIGKHFSENEKQILKILLWAIILMATLETNIAHSKFEFYGICTFQYFSKVLSMTSGPLAPQGFWQFGLLWHLPILKFIIWNSNTHHVNNWDIKI